MPLKQPGFNFVRMNKPKDKIEELYQQHLDAFDKAPDDSLWEGIEANLPPENKTRLPWAWMSLAALLLITLGGGYYMYQANTSKQENKILTQQTGDNQSTKTSNETPITDKPGNIEPDIPGINEKQNLTETPTYKRKEVTVQTSGIAISATVKEKRGEDNINPAKVNIGLSKATNETNMVIQNSKSEESEITNESDKNTDLAVEKIAEPSVTSDLYYLKSKEVNFKYSIPFDTKIAYQAQENTKHKEPLVFIPPAEVFVAITPSLNYYRVFSNALISQFDGANNGSRIGWTLQAGVVYPLRHKKLKYRASVGYFSSQSDFKYKLTDSRQEIHKLDNNTIEYIPVQSMQSESKRWHVLEIQNDILYRIRPNHELIIGLKAGSNFTEKPIFHTYLAYRLSKPIASRQMLWIEPSYAYALNAQQSANHTFSYRMDKYGLRVGLSYLLK